MQQLPEALAALGAYKQFVTYKIVPSATRLGKMDKLPWDYVANRKVDAHDPTNWTDVASAIDTGHPIGFVFTEHDPFWFLDIDGCLIDGQWSPIAQQLCQLLSGSAVEISQSGTGLHIFGVGRPPAHGCRNDALGLEFYHTKRFAALTGAGAIGNCAVDMSAVLPTLVAQYFPPDASQGVAQGWTEEPCEGWCGPEDDADLIRRAMQSRSATSAFGDKASFADLWLADVAALSRAYPDPARPYDCNRADSALAQHLSFWTGKNCERIRALMEQSKLARDKWEREDYLPRTILAVVGRQSDVLQDKPVVIPAPVGPIPASAVPTVIEGSRIIHAADQVTLFTGAVYIRDQHKALISGGRIIKADQFRVHFGGYSFQMDPANERMSRDPWEAWTQSQLFSCPKVDGTCFRPDLDPSVIIERDGQSFVNTYVPVDIPRKAGDPSPFLNHLARVLPDDHDRQILLSYMAACVQHKGVKFQWAPLLQGVEGNGKTLFTRCVAQAVGRRYVHWPKASKLCNQFNSWMVGKLFFAVEDIVVPNSKLEIIEELKPMITGDELEIEGKGVDQISSNICGNFMFNCNPKDGLLKTRNDRRFAVFHTAQQQNGDLKDAGMHGDYFPDLYKWLRADGYAIVADLLHTYAIPAAYNPAGDCQRAPLTSSTEDAIRASAGGVEQEIEEAVAQGLPGFGGGWISSIWLERLLERLGLARRVTHNKRKEILEGMGYSYHPALKDGRANNVVMPDGSKSRLFIHESSLARQITGPSEAAKNYEAANTQRMSAALPFTQQVRG